MHSEFGRIVKGTLPISGRIRAVRVNNKVQKHPQFFEMCGNVQKWGHRRRNGDTPQKWGHTWAADVAGGGDLASAVMISGKIPLWVARTLRAGAKFVRICFARGPWLSWLERSVHIRKVTGSSPVGPIPASGKCEHIRRPAKNTGFSRVLFFRFALVLPVSHACGATGGATGDVSLPAVAR